MIDIRLKLTVICFILFIIVLIIHFIKKDKMNLKYAIIWFISLFVLLIFTIFPEVLGLLTKLVGIQVSSNFLFALLISFLFIMCISLTIIVSQQKDQIRKLIQEVSLLKSDKNEQ